MLPIFVVCSAFLIATVYGSGELTIVHHPSSLVFKGHDHVKESILKEIYSASMGFSTEQYSNWDGLYIENPFNLAEAVVTIAIEGIPNIGHGKGHHFPLKTDEDEGEVFDALEKRVTERYPEGESQLIRADLSEGAAQLNQYEIFSNIKHEKSKKPIHVHFKSNVDEDREFLKEITLLNEIVEILEKSVVKSDNIPDIYWFKVSSLHALTDLYGENSTHVKEAKQLLNEVTVRLSNAFKKIYNGRVLVTVVTSDAVHTRRSRSILEAEAKADNAPENPNNIAKNYSPDYPVIFNIMLWFGVIMIFSLIAICMAIGDMDPGRDSIIYRMTSTRLKKDN